MTTRSTKRPDASTAPFVMNVVEQTAANSAFRHVLFTGARMQVVVMSLPPNGEIGEETHERVEQALFCVRGKGILHANGRFWDFESGDIAVVPPGVRHNIIENTGLRPLDLVTIYTPPNHLPNRVHETKQDAEADAEDAAFDAGAQERFGASLASLSRELLYGAEHKLGLRVPRAGASCASCTWLHPAGPGPHCTNQLWQLWPRERGGGGGKSRLPVNDAATFCCDLWRAAPSAAATSATAGKTESLLRKLLAAAEAHGEESGVEHEAGDLRDLFTACWKRLNPEQRRDVYAEHEALRNED